MGPRGLCAALAFILLAACGCKSSTAAAQPCSPPDYTSCPNYPPSTMHIINQSTDSSVNLGTMLPTPGAPGDTASPVSEYPLPGHSTCQLLGRWQPDSAVLVASFSGFNRATGRYVRANLGLFNLRSSPGWIARFDSANTWHFGADTACSNPSPYTF